VLNDETVERVSTFNTWATIEMFKSSIFWDISPCSLVKVTGRFGETYRAANYLLQSCSLLGLFVDPENVGDMSPPKRRLTFAGLRGVISHKMDLFIDIAVSEKIELFITIAVRTQILK
jgi:hypothetical protein